MAAANIVFYDDGSGPQKGGDSLVSFLVDSDRACEVWLKGPEEREREGRDKNMTLLRGRRPLEGPRIQITSYRKIASRKSKQTSGKVS